MPFMTINGAELYYESAGTGEPIILVHAGIADSRMWQPQFEVLLQHYHVVRYDMRGFGQSKPVAGAYVHTNDLRELLNALNLDKVTLVGCSMGGGYCFDFTLAYPQRVKKLVLVASRPFGEPMDDETVAGFAAVEAAGDDLDKINELELLNWVVGRGRTIEAVDPQVYQLAAQMNRQALAYEYQEIGDEQDPMYPDAVERMGEVATPTLVIYGEHDRAYVHNAAEAMVATMPNARKVLLPHAAHLPNLDQPEAFNRALLDFLNA